MATLTPTEIARVRMMSGDNCGSPNDYEISDSDLQKLHDYGLTMDECACTGSLDLTIMLMWEARVARAANLFDEDGEGGARSVSQKYDHLVTQLERWERKCGLSGGRVVIGKLSMGLDTQDIDEFSNEDLYPPYWGYYS